MSMSTTSPRRHFVYVLSCGDNAFLYCGYTIDWKRRLKQHRKGQGAKYTRPYKHSLRLVALWEFLTSKDARRSEYLFKQLNRVQKSALVYSGTNLFGGIRVKIKAEV